MRPQKHVFIIFSSLILANPHALAIIKGEKTNDAYKAIGSLVAVNQKVSFCTATLIHPDWIILANHCRETGSEAEPHLYKPEEMIFQIGEDSNHPEYQVKLSQWHQQRIVNPEDPREVIELDMAFAKLSHPITRVNKIPLEPIEVFMGDVANNIKSSFEIVGYGYTHPVGYGSEKGLRLKAPYKITSMENNALLNLFGDIASFKDYLLRAHSGEEEITERHLSRTENLIPHYQAHAWDPTNRDNGNFTERPAAGWSNSCNGDSGAPLLITQNNKKYVAGIIQSGFNGNSLGCIELGSIVGLMGPEVKKFIKKIQSPLVPLFFNKLQW